MIVVQIDPITYCSSKRWRREKGKMVDKEKKYNIYLQERDSIIRQVHEQQSSLDKYIITISTGAFGVSLAIVKYLETITTIEGQNLLVVSWFLFIATIVITLSSFVFSQAALRKQLSIMRKWYDQDELSEEDERNRYSNITKWTNGIYLVLFVAGVGFMIAFGWINIP